MYKEALHENAESCVGDWTYCHDLAQYLYVTRFSFLANNIHWGSVRREDHNTWHEYPSEIRIAI